MADYGRDDSGSPLPPPHHKRVRARQAAIHRKRLAVHIRRLITRQEQGHVGDLVRLAVALQGVGWPILWSVPRSRVRWNMARAVDRIGALAQCLCRPFGAAPAGLTLTLLIGSRFLLHIVSKYDTEKL